MSAARPPGRRLPRPIASWRFGIHPDKNPGDDEAIVRFKEAAEAFEVLNDRQTPRALRSLRPCRRRRTGRRLAPLPGRERHLLRFRRYFWRRGVWRYLWRAGPTRTSKGGDVRCDITLDLVEAARGVTRTFQFERHERCTTCDGIGAQPGTERQKCSIAAAAARSCNRQGFSACRRLVPPAMVPVRPSASLRWMPRRRVTYWAGCSGEVQIPAGIDDSMRGPFAG